MDAEGNGLSMQGLAQKLEELTERLGGLERENAGLRQKLAALAGSGANGAAAALAPERALDIERPLSRKALLGKAGAAAVAAMAAGILLSPREAQALESFDELVMVITENNNNVTELGGLGRAVYGYHNFSTGVEGVSGRNGFAGVFGWHTDGSVGPGVLGQGKGDWPAVWGQNTQGTGVEGFGMNGVVGVGSRPGFSGVYGRHNSDVAGPGVTGDGKGNAHAGVLGRNPEGIGVRGESSANGYGSVYGEHKGTSGYGVVGDGKGAGSAGVLGRNSSGGGFGVHGQGATSGVRGESTAGYGGQFGGGRAQLRLVPGSREGHPTTGAHNKGELYMDSAAALFVCALSGTPGTWRKVTTAVS